MTIRHCWMLILALLAIVSPGCSTWDDLIVRSQSPDKATVEDNAEEPRTKLVGHMAVPYNMKPVRVEAVGLVVGLDGTGGDPPPSPQRAVLLSEMQTRQVDKPNRVLQSPNTAMVIVQGILRPGVQEGDHFDIELRVPTRSDTTSLRGGRLLETRLTELRVLGGQIHEGHLLAKANGPVMVDP